MHLSAPFGLFALPWSLTAVGPPSAIDISWNTENGPEPPRTALVYWDSAWGPGPTFKSFSGVQPTKSRVSDHRRPVLPSTWEEPAPEVSITASSTVSSSKSSTSVSSAPASSSLASPTRFTSRRTSSTSTSLILVSFTTASLSETSTQASSTPASSTMRTLTRAPRPTGAPISKPTHPTTTVLETSTSASATIIVITKDPVTHTVFVPIPTPSFVSAPASLSHTPSNPSFMDFGDGPWDHEGGKGMIQQHQESSQNYENHINQGKKEKDSDGEMSESWNEVDTKYNSNYKSETGYEGERDRETKEYMSFEEDGDNGEFNEEWDFEG